VTPGEPSLWRREGERVLASTKVLELRSVRYVHPVRGTQKDFVVAHAPDWVNVVALTPDGRIVLVNQFRFGANALSLEIPGGVIEKGECDFVAEVAGEMPSYVIAELMGLPLADGRELYKLTETIHSAPETLPPGAGREAVLAMFAYASGVIAEKRARPADDLATRLLAAEVEGRRLTDPEFLLFFLLLIDAGGDTTRNLLSAGLLALQRNPDQRAWLLADLTGRLASAREELLRFTSPVIYMRRTATRNAEVAGTRIAAGDKVVMYFGAANRDPGQFENPDALDLARAPNDHLAFGAGPHVCLGQHLARLEIDAILTEVLTRMHDLEIVAPPEWLASTFISGPRSMKVRFRPGARV